MFDQRLLQTEFLVAELTFVRFLIHVEGHVTLKVAHIFESLTALVALKISWGFVMECLVR